eukprot:CAMPEP_0171127154 /NCGR_PEP_ID=MMETSP0766_2-20121228/114726_1 /TAXON_ID=439317 /ORGANISM="Gambierdiscus australes, Strain CAWD 149" /LENGTH=195 /DNA_ID=CAMNT_0011590241 /DNA_START=24 /DNA_END=608 /DNA_ORIENTATION=-
MNGVLDHLQPTVDDLLRLQHASPELRDVAWPCARELLLCALFHRSPGTQAPPPLAISADPRSWADLRAPTLAALGRLGWLTGDAGALAAAVTLIKEDNARIRLAAAAAVVRIAGPHRGSVQALALLWPCLSHESGVVRSCALAALGGIAEKGHAGAVGAARAALEDTSVPVQVAALGVLRRIAPEGQLDVVQDVA